MKSVVSLLAALFAITHSASALQLILSTREPMCLFVTPRRIGGLVDINYSISGVNEDQVEFLVSKSEVSLCCHSHPGVLLVWKRLTDFDCV